MFAKFKDAVSRQFDLMKEHMLYRTDVEKDLLWMTYLESWPEGTNPIMRENREHDCSACRSFIKAVGSMVALVGDDLVCLWDCEVEEPYATVADEMRILVKSAPIRNILLHDNQYVGIDKNHEGSGDDILTWHHFHIKLPGYCVWADRGSAYAAKKSARDVFARALSEITPEAIETVVELIKQGSLYRGEEHLFAVNAFANELHRYNSLKAKAPLTKSRRQELFTWRQNIPEVITHIRNSAIGSLLTDLSYAVGLDSAVRKFESKVAPYNYKRPKALATKGMIEQARKKVEELGYGPSLGRRFAVASDITVNNVLFANRDARKAMGADAFDELLSEATVWTRKSLDKVEKVSIDKFIKDILPKADSIELLLENRHAGNLVNLVAPEDPEAKSLFKWDNGFSWAYQGDLADSIKERVKARGGSVTGDFRASLAWFNSDDLDLHLVEPNGYDIHFGSKLSPATRGELDVDMNVGSSGPKFSRNAVENITYPNRNKMLEGNYRLIVHNYTHRESRDVGFEVELEFDGVTTTFSCDREVRPREQIAVASFTYSKKTGIKFGMTLPRADASREIWGLKTQVYHPVTMMMLSPNHWNDRPVGNKHYFFMLQDCKRDGSSRGFFNEYLDTALNPHRKVFEMLGSKMRTEEEGEQLSGLGFSSTQRSNVYAKITGAFTRTINITF